MAHAAGAGGGGGGVGRRFLIPVQGEDPIEVTSADLPADSDELSEVLLTVSAPVHVWVEFLGEYYRQGRLAEFEKLLRKALSMRE